MKFLTQKMINVAFRLAVKGVEVALDKYAQRKLDFSDGEFTEQEIRIAHQVLNLPDDQKRILQRLINAKEAARKLKAD